MPKSSTGRMSPIRAHTMKDFEQQLSDLKKENFNLKLRIYFLEERQERKWDADGEDLIKTNIQLNVEVETLKKDLMDKTELINQAATTVESLRLKQQQSASRPEDSSRVQELESQLLTATDDAEKAKFALAQVKEQLREMQDQMRDESMRRWAEGGGGGGGDADPTLSIASLKGDVKERRGMEFSPSPDSDKDSGAAIMDAPNSGGTFLDETELNLLEKKASLLDQLLPPSSFSSSSSSSAYLTQLAEDVARVAEELRTVASTKDRLSNCKCGAAEGNLPRHTFEDLEDLVETQETETRKMVAEIADLKAEVETREAALEAVEDQLKAKTKAAEEADTASAASIEKLELELAEKESAYEKGLRTIQGMTKILHQKEKEIDELQTSLDEAGEERRLLEGQMATAVSKSQKDKDQDARDKSDRLLRVQELEETLRDKKLELERVQKSNERKDNELANLNIQLDAVEERLRAADFQVQDLRDELQSEKQKANDRADSTQQHFQTLLDEAQRESANKDRLINRLSRSLKDRDDSIGELLEASELSSSGTTSPNKQMEFINKLKERLRERDKAVEDALSDKASCLEEKEEDLRKLRRQLRDREREVENSNAVLLATEETIEALERDIKDKENVNKKLAAELKDKDKLLRENSDIHTTSTKELEATIQRLQAALDAQNRLPPPASEAGDETIKSLRDALIEKDRFIQELLKERADAARQSDEAAQKLVIALSDKDGDIKNLYEKEEKEKAELNRRILELTTDLNRKKFELEQAENRGQWSGEQQAETISQLRQALKEKDEVIQSLVESGRGKDVLLCSTSPSIRDPEVEEKMKEMRVNKEKAEKENRKLKKQLQEKESEIKSQQVVTDRLKKEATTNKTKADESQKKLQKEIQILKESIETIKGESTLDVNQNIKKLQDELDALRRALESAGIRSVTDPQKIGIEIGHLIRRASITNGDAANESNADPGDSGAYSILRDAAEAERKAYATMASALNGDIDGVGVNAEALAELREELEKITTLRHNLEQALGGFTEKETPKKMTPSKLKLQTKGGKSPQGTRLAEDQRDLQNATSSAAFTAAGATAGADAEDTVSTSTASFNGKTLTYDDPARLHQQLRQKEKELKKREEENQSLREQLISKHRDTSPRLSSNSSSEDTSHIQDASFSASSITASNATEFKQEEARAKIKKQKKKLKAADRLIELLKKQIQLNKDTGEESGFDPQLIVELAAEIERLKSDLEEAKVKLRASYPSKTSKKASSSSPSSSSSMKPPSGKSHIPVRSRSLTDQFGNSISRSPSRESLDAQPPSQQQQQLSPQKSKALKDMNERLAGKLAATEATVRRVAKKARHYRFLLEKSGALTTSLRRSSSESMLERLCNDDDVDVLNSSNGNIFDDEFDKNDIDDRLGFSRAQSCASLTNAEPLADKVDEGDIRKESLKAWWSQSSPSLLLSKGDIERITLEAAKSQDVGFLKSSMEALKEQLGRHSDTIGDLRSRLSNEDNQPINASMTDAVNAGRLLDDTTAANLDAFQGLQQEISNLKNQLESTQSANQSLQRQLLEATLPIDGASDPNDSSKPVKPARSQHHASAPSIGRGDSSPISGRSAAGDDIKEREKEVLALKKQIADAHNLCQCLKDSVDDLESLVDTALGAAESEAPTEGSTHNSTPRTKAAIGRQFHQAKSTTQNLLKALQRGGDIGSDLSLDPAASKAKAAEIVNLEEANEDLREEVDRLTTELQSATSLHSAWEKQMAALEAEAAELHAEVGALRNLLNEKNAQNAKYRGILAENQSAAASARDELERLAEEVQGKDLLISQLHQKLKKATARLHQAQTAGNTIYSTTEDEEEPSATKATPRAGRHAHPPRPHRKFHRHKTPSSASEGDWAEQQLQQQQSSSGKWSGSRGEVTGRSLDEDEADSPDAIEIQGVLPAVGIGFPSSSGLNREPYSASGPSLINNAAAQMTDVTCRSVGTQCDPALTGSGRSSSHSHPPTADTPQMSHKDSSQRSNLASIDATPPPPPDPPHLESHDTQTDLELVLRFAEEISMASNPLQDDGTSKTLSKLASTDPFDVTGASRASRPDSSSRKCLFPEQRQSSSHNAPPPLHPASRTSAIDDSLLVDEDHSASGSEDAEDSVRHSPYPKTVVRQGGVGGPSDEVNAFKTVENLQTRLRDSELLNETLKEELEVVNSLMAAMGDESRLAENSTSQADDDPTNVLKEHLTEMRRLRKQLENQIQTHRNLGDNIEERMKARETIESPSMMTTTTTTTTTGLRTDIYLRQSPIGRTQNDEDLSRRKNGDQAAVVGEEEAAVLRAETEAARAEAELFRAEVEAARRDQSRAEAEKEAARRGQTRAEAEMEAALREQSRAEAELSKAVADAETKFRDIQDKLNHQLQQQQQQLQQRQRALEERLESTEAENASLRSKVAEKEKELLETKKTLKETKDLVNAVKTELSILSKMKKDRRAKEKKTELEFTAEYMKEMEKLREQLREAVKENQRLRHRLEEFQVPGADQPINGSKTSVGQEVHVHHDCAAAKRPSVNGKSPAASALPNGIASPGALANGKENAVPDNVHVNRDQSAPTCRPPTFGGGGVTSGSALRRRRSHSSSEGEDAKVERIGERRRSGERGGGRGAADEAKEMGAKTRGSGNGGNRDLRRGSDSGLWSLTGALNKNGANGDDGNNALTGVLEADRLHLTPRKKSHDNSLHNNSHSPKNNTSYFINELDKKGIRVSGNLRYLFAVGRLDDLELLKKEVAESKILIEGLCAVTKDRIKHLNAKSHDKNPEFGLLRKMEVGFANLTTLLGEVERLGAEFWTSTFPAHGIEKDAKQSFESSQTGEPEEVSILKCKLKTQERLLHQAISRLEATNKLKEGVEDEVIKRLTMHYKVLKDARNNLENFQLPAATE